MIIRIFLATLLFSIGLTYSAPKTAPTLEIVSTQKIWDKVEHAAFTDLMRHNGVWYLTFRESDQHAAGKDGIIRILQSEDGENWKTAAVIKKQGIDLRDPKLSITPEGQFLLVIGGSEYSDEGQWITSRSYVALSSDGKNWSDLTQILEDKEWLWRVTWDRGTGYGIAYRSIPGKGRIATLYSTTDGIHYSPLQVFDITHNPSEATIRFLKDSTMVILIRRGGNAWIGTSEAPYTDVYWSESEHYLGGPNFVILPDGRMIASGRVYNEDLSEKTAVLEMTATGLKRLFDLPSGGDDTSYPGMVVRDGELWISYYSSHEGSKTSIYLSKIKY